MQRLLVLFLLALTVRGGLADDEKFPLMQVGGLTYTNVTVFSHNTTEIYFRHDGGLGNARLSSLSKELRDLYGYDPIAVKLADKRRAEAQAIYQQGAVTYASIRSRTVLENSIDAEETKAAKVAELADACSDLSPIGKTAPVISMDRWLSNSPPPSEGKFTLLFFYKTSSEPCRRAIPELNQFHRKLPAKLVVIGINMDSAQTQPQADVKVPDIDFACGVDPNGQLARQLEITSLPTVAVIDPRKKIRYVGHPAALGDEVFTKLLGD